MVKLIVLIKKNPDLSQEEFSRYWEEVHGPLVMKCIPGMRRYVQNHVLKIPGSESHFDGVLEIWYDDMESYKASTEFFSSEDGKVVSEDGAKFMDNSKSVFILVEEKVDEKIAK